MLTKDPSKVKSVIEESPITQKCKSQEIVHTLRKLRFDIYIIAESLPESLDFVGGEGGGGVPCREGMESLLQDPRAFLPILGRYMCVEESLDMVYKLKSLF